MQGNVAIAYVQIDEVAHPCFMNLISQRLITVVFGKMVIMAIELYQKKFVAESQFLMIATSTNEIVHFCRESYEVFFLSIGIEKFFAVVGPACSGTEAPA